MKKVIALAVLLILAITLPLAVYAETGTVQDVPYRTTDLTETDADYYKELALAEMWNFKQIRNFPTLYTKKVGATIRLPLPICWATTLKT